MPFLLTVFICNGTTERAIYLFVGFFSNDLWDWGIRLYEGSYYNKLIKGFS